MACSKPFNVIEAELELISTMLTACNKCGSMVQNSKFESELIFEGRVFDDILCYGEQLEKQRDTLQAELNN